MDLGLDVTGPEVRFNFVSGVGESPCFASMPVGAAVVYVARNYDCVFPTVPSSFSLRL